MLCSEVRSECARFGSVLGVLAFEEGAAQSDGWSWEGGSGSEVKVLVLFVGEEGAAAARSALDGRWFGGRRVRAEAVGESLWLKHRVKPEKKSEW
eukprot:4976512-Pleurochrysis_carterae.AAC.1